MPRWPWENEGVARRVLYNVADRIAGSSACGKSNLEGVGRKHRIGLDIASPRIDKIAKSLEIVRSVYPGELLQGGRGPCGPLAPIGEPRFGEVLHRLTESLGRLRMVTGMVI